ncbi:MAG: hypothetical protein IMZ44_19430 [Planctomycetes bacterium]|nr:hypothetical protein [Planctomycetota bacterium]
MSEDRKFDEYLERRAEQLGLPTDPEAYQDGGLAEATLCTTIGEAETLVALLRANDVPAWVKAPLSAMAGASPLIFPVLVPLGRLADAQKLIAQEGKTEVLPNGEAVQDGEAIQTPPTQEEEEERPTRWGAARIFATVLVAGLVLGLVLGLIGAAYFLVSELLR